VNGVALPIFITKNGYGVGACHGKPLRHAKLTLKIGRSTPFMGFWSYTQVVHRLPNLRKIIKTTTDKPCMPSLRPTAWRKGKKAISKRGFSPLSNFLGRGLGVKSKLFFKKLTEC